MTGLRVDIAYLPLGAAAFGGAERSLLDLACEMVKRGSSVIVLAGEALRDTPFPHIAAERGIPIEWVGLAPEKGLVDNLREAIRVFRRYAPRIIHFNISWRRRMWVVPVVARLWSKAKLIGSMRAMPDPHELVPRKRHLGFLPGLRLWHLPELVVGRVWARTLHVTVSINAKDIPRRLAQNYGFPTARIRVIYNGIAAPSQLPTVDQKDSIRRSLGVQEGGLLIAYSGRLSKEKGVDVLVRALGRMPESYRLVLVGEGPQRDELRQLVGELGLSERVYFAGFLRDPNTVVGAADIVVVPSLWYEAFGRVVVEAMALGVPVLASRIGGMAELFDDGVEGWYAPPNDPAALASVLARFDTDRETLRLAGVAARRLVKTRYSLDRVQQQYSELYTTLSREGN